MNSLVYRRFALLAALFAGALGSRALESNDYKSMVS